MIGLRDVEVARERIHSFIQQTPFGAQQNFQKRRKSLSILNLNTYKPQVVLSCVVRPTLS